MPTQQNRIFILNGHPAETSLSHSFTNAYANAARDAGHDVRLTHIHNLNFDMDYGYGGYENHKPLEPELEKFLNGLEWCEHLVMTTPMWWGGLPAKLKGLFDRALLPGRTYSTRETDWMGMPTPMLKGRTARVILTSDTPGWFLKLAYNNALIRQLKGQILGFIGFKPVRITYFSGASHPKTGEVEKWMSTVRKLAGTGT